MLLLVLILVLIAFGLLVVALLTGSVLWAWVSVGVSVAAAAVLLVDWLQRRNAVKAGTAVAAESNGAAPAPEPATEILPVIRPDAAAGPGNAAVNGAPKKAPGDRFDRLMDGTQTVVMPAVQPSGSADRPSGATGGISPSSSNSSLSVTKSGADRPSSTPPSSDAGAAPAEPAGRSGATVSSPGMTPPAAKESGAPSAGGAAASRSRGEAPGEATSTTTGAAKPTDTSALESTMAMDARELGTAGAPVVTEHGSAGRTQAEPATSGGPTATGTSSGLFAPAAATDAAATETSATTSSDTAAPVGDAPVEGATASSPAGGGSAAAVVDGSSTGTGSTAPPTTSDDHGEAPRSDTPAGTPDAGVTDAGATAAGAAPAEPAQVAADADAEAPEEPPDVAVSALVAALDDEVVVIDEQPRYHVEGCRALVGKPLIPLPAREAIELGFTPCGWCTPDRTLASRHAAPTR